MDHRRRPACPPMKQLLASRSAARLEIEARALAGPPA
jgi:hypothetical protein